MMRSRIASFQVGSLISWLKLKIFIKFTSSSFNSLFLWSVPHESHLSLKSPKRTNGFLIVSICLSTVECKLSENKS